MQVEKVICYDVFSSPIRGIQRMGRTGRHEAGKVVHIITEGQEESKFNNNAEVENQRPFVQSTTLLETFKHGSRLIPAKAMTMPLENPEHRPVSTGHHSSEHIPGS